MVFVQDFTPYYKYTIPIANSKVKHVLCKLCSNWTMERSAMCAVGLSERLQEMQIAMTFSVVHTIPPFKKRTLSPSGQTSSHPPCVENDGSRMKGQCTLLVALC